MKLRPLNRKETSAILLQIQEEYGVDAKKLLIDDYVFFQSDKNKVYIIDAKIKEVNLDFVRVNSFGLYFCELAHGNVRLSMEGSKIIGEHATKNVLVLDNDIAKQWLLGNDIPCEQEYNGYVIIKNNNDYIGCGKYKEGKIFNFVPKQRRIRE